MYGQTIVLAEGNSWDPSKKQAGQTENFGLNAYLLSKTLSPVSDHKNHHSHLYRATLIAQYARDQSLE